MIERYAIFPGIKKGPLTFGMLKYAACRHVVLKHSKVRLYYCLANNTFIKP